MVVCGLAVAATVAYAQNQGEKAEGKPELRTVEDKVSYGFGLNQGRRLKQGGIELNPELMARGFADAFAGRDPLLTDEELQAAFQEFEQTVAAAQAERMQEQAEKNKREGEKFLAENKKKEGVKTTESGLQYEVLESGDGKSPKLTDTVTTHYHGTLIDGTVFDSSVQRNEPATFPVSGVIKGWTEALQKMKVGDKWRLVVPSDLAYGENPRPGSPIGPNAVLIFEVELLDVQEGEGGLNLEGLNLDDR
jgi:FKBP-type peptidyl-prolyl cis-trans isomerase FklB